MTITVGKIKVDIITTRHATYSMGAIITWPDGKKSYGEYRSVKEVMNRVTGKPVKH